MTADVRALVDVTEIAVDAAEIVVVVRAADAVGRVVHVAADRAVDRVAAEAVVDRVVVAVEIAAAVQDTKRMRTEQSVQATIHANVSNIREGTEASVPFS